MKEDICSIPITDIFEKNDACPICKMYDILQKRAVDFALGDSKMQPSIRKMTNKDGFCRRHLDMMILSGERAALATILESRLAELAALGEKETAAKLKADKGACFVCNRIEGQMQTLLNEMYYLYETEEEFRVLFGSQKNFCFEHFKMLYLGADRSPLKRQKKAFRAQLFEKYNKNITELHADIKRFCTSFSCVSKVENDENSKRCLEKYQELF